MSRRILVTGAAGFVGAYLCNALLECGDEVLRLGMRRETPSDEALDLRDADKVFAAVRKLKPSHVIHLAAQSSVSKGSLEIFDTYSVNVGGTLNLASAIACHVPEAVVVFASSAEVYGASFLVGSLCESAPLVPLSTYGKSKRLAEEVLISVLPTSVKLIIARPFNHSGKGQREDFVLPSFASQIARIEAGIQSPKLKTGNIDIIRDFLHVTDVVAAYRALLDEERKLPSRFVCNICSNKAFSLRDLVECMRASSRVPFELVTDPSRARRTDLPVVKGDASLLRCATGWVPTKNINDLLGDLLDEHRRLIALRVAGPSAGAGCLDSSG